MFTKEESSRIRQEFWIAFGRYMSPILSSEETKVSWLNYHTQVKDVHFRMDAGVHSGTISISIEHSDPEIQELYFEQFKQSRSILHEMLGEEWEWQLHAQVNGKIISRIYKELPDVSVMDKGQWSDLISFFKPRIIALDAFWENAKWSFESLK